MLSSVSARALPGRKLSSPRAGRLVVKVDAKMKVVVTGASGRTGSLVVQKLVQKPQEFEPRAVVRSSSAKAKVAALGVPDSAIFTADISTGQPEAFGPSFAGADALIIVTSGVPELQPLSLIPVFWAKLTGKEGVSPKFSWKQAQLPEQVDWLGQKAQIDAAKAAGLKHVVLVSSMGGTQPENSLNKLGDGNILLWKRRAEQYLVESKLTYTIVHPGGLTDKKGGERVLVVDVDDKLMARKAKSVSREDVAAVSVAALTLPQAKNKSFDLCSLEPEEAAGQAPTTDFGALLDSLGGRTCDYSLNRQL